jgi:GTP cyclohydrolase II
MLHALGVSRVALLSNNPDKARQLRSCGVTVVEQVPTGVYVSAANQRYLETKARRGRHTLELPAVFRDDDDRSRLPGLSTARVSGRTR